LRTKSEAVHGLAFLSTEGAVAVRQKTLRRGQPDKVQ